MRALIVADGDVSATDAPPVTAGRLLVVAADGGARKAAALGLVPDVVVGDMDSLDAEALAELEARGVEVLRHPAGKDESDTELAIREALDRGAQELVILGALGGSRLDHSLANVLLLTLPQLAGCEVALVAGPVTVRVLGVAGADSLELRGGPGDLVSLLPLTDRVSGVTTTGLAYPLDDETLHQGPARGLSNVLVDQRGTVATASGRLAVVHTRRDADGAPDG